MADAVDPPAPEDQSRPALSGLRVLDCSESVAGQFTARLLADHGADVVLVEPPGGSRLRAVSSLEPGDSLFWHLNTGKRSILRSHCSPALVAAADVIIGEPAGDGRAPASHRIHCTIDEFGGTGPYAFWRGGELIQQSLCGLAFSTGSHDGAPLYGFGHRAAYSAGAAAYSGIMAALYERRRSGLGQSVEISVFDIAAAMSQNLFTQYSYNQTYPSRGRYPGPLGHFRTANGWIFLFILPGRWAALCGILGLAEYAEDRRFTSNDMLMRHWTDAMDLLAAAMAGWTREQLVTALQANRLAASLSLTPEQIWHSEDLRQSGYWRWTDIPASPTSPTAPAGSAGRPRLGPLSDALADPVAVSTGAPLIGAHNDTVSQDWTDRSSPFYPASGRPSTSGAGTRPLVGLRVLELTTSWAGPLAGRILAFFGADVIKVESLRSPDAWRGPAAGGDPQRYPDREPGEHPYNRSAWFNAQNLDKRSIELDLKNAGGAGVMRGLVAQTDVLICNLAPGSLGRLGLSYPQLDAIRPGIIVAEISAFGSSGPMVAHLGVGPTVEATTGATELIGYGEGEPQGTGSAYLDPIGALSTADEILTGLVRRQRTGAGSHIEISLRHASMQWLGEYIQTAADGAAPGAATGNRIAGQCPHGIYRAAGPDQWIAVAAQDDAQWRALCRVLERPDLAADPGLSTVVGRKAREQSIERALEQWTSTRDKHAGASEMQAGGVAAAAVNSAPDLIANPHLSAIDFYCDLPHPEVGVHRHNTIPIRLSRTPGHTATAAPCLGQHTDQILSEVLRMDREALDGLRATGALDASRMPIQGNSV